jgi:dihydrofolate reductase
MRKIVISELVSLDGFFEGPDGNFMAMPLHDCFDEYNAERLEAADTLLLGGRTYRGFASFWPEMLDNPEAGPLVRRIAARNNAIQKVVVSDTVAAQDTGAWQSSTDIVRRADAHAYLAALKEQDGGDIVLFGSATLANDLLAAGLADEVHLLVGPAALGSGTALFTQPVSGLRLVDVRRFDGAEHIVLRYAC